MINEDLLRQAGWTDDLIEATKKVADQLSQMPFTAVSAELEILDLPTVIDSASLDLSSVNPAEFSWPTF